MKQKYSVLVIDDQKNWRELLTEILDGQFEVISVSSYDEALSTIHHQKPPFHVVVTDMRLVDGEEGNEDGLKLIEYLNQRGDETKTIVITGYATVSTAKRALSRLAAYEYLEKLPSNGLPWNITGFQQIVYQAAEEAEKKRPYGLADVTQNILLLEPDLPWRKKLKESLNENGYQVNIVAIDEKLDAFLKNDTTKYALILLNESLCNKNLLATLHTLHPGTKIIILTSRDIDHIFKAMRDYPVLTAFTLHNENFDSSIFREFIHSALAYGAIKYILVQIEFDNQPIQTISSKSNVYEMTIGRNYSVVLSIQDNPIKGATGIWLSPGGAKKGKTHLHLFIHAKQMKLEPVTDAYWNIPLSNERPHPFKFSITPQAPGKNEIVIEIDQNHRWPIRIKIEIDVIK